MKSKLVTLAIFVLSFVTSSAQLNSSPVVSNEKAVLELPGKLFTQFLQAIKPGSLNSTYSKDKKNALLAAAKTNSAEQFAKNISAITGYIKPELFKTGFDMTSMIGRSNTAKKMSASVEMLKDLEKGLKPEALTEGWKLARTGWLDEINKIK